VWADRTCSFLVPYSYSDLYVDTIIFILFHGGPQVLTLRWGCLKREFVEYWARDIDCVVLHSDFIGQCHRLTLSLYARLKMSVFRSTFICWGSSFHRPGQRHALCVRWDSRRRPGKRGGRSMLRAMWAAPIPLCFLLVHVRANKPIVRVLYWSLSILKEY